MDFVTSLSFRKDEPLTSWTLFSTYLSSKLDSPLINNWRGLNSSLTKTLERENLILTINMLKKVFNWSEFHLSEMACYKIQTWASLVKSTFCHFLQILGKIWFDEQRIFGGKEPNDDFYFLEFFMFFIFLFLTFKAILLATEQDHVTPLDQWGVTFRIWKANQIFA